MEDKMIDDLVEALKGLDGAYARRQEAVRFATLFRAALLHLELYDLSGRGRDEDLIIIEPGVTT